jgi:uncharacterized DUF497 family protein
MTGEFIFEWDERKRLSNHRKHGYDFADCAAVFGGPTATYIDDGDNYGETRFRTYGVLDGRVMVVAHTETANCVRVISMRKARLNEQANYFKAFFD